MEQYTDFATVYETFMDSTPYDVWGTFVAGLIERYGVSKPVRDRIADLEAAKEKKFGTPEKSSVKIQLKWLPDAQFMGYYVALDKGFYKDVGLDVTIVPGGGDIAETTAVYTGQVDFGVTWVTNLAVANASGMNLLEIAQVFQKSGLVLVYKYSD